MNMTRIYKTLSLNDVGETGTHQAGILVPKLSDVLRLFPSLGSETKNPRATVRMLEDTTGREWRLQFIYYNNRAFGGTRNEYRLTGMTKCLREMRARAGDRLFFWRPDEDAIRISLERHDAPTSREGRVLLLSSSWVVLNR